jgi:hypothetical protein
LAGIGVIAVVATIAAGYVLLPLAVRGFVRLLTLTLNASVWFAAALGSGNDAWTIASAVGRAGASALVTPQISAIIAGLVLIGAVALFGLQRLLGTEEDSSR